MHAHRSKTSSWDRTLAVEEGRVVCPLNGPVDIERCWACRAFDGLSTGHIEGVVCRSPAFDATRPTVDRQVPRGRS